MIVGRLASEEVARSGRGYKTSTRAGSRYCRAPSFFAKKEPA